MTLQEPSTILMIELLSLEHNGAGYQIEIGVTRNIGFVRSKLTIDQFTYEQLIGLGPLTGERMRLSLYPKWDPFRNSYYSTLIIMNKAYSENLYFACSEYYVTQLQQLKEQDYHQAEDERIVQEMPPSIEPESRLNRNKTRKKTHKPKRLALLGFMSACLMLLLSFQVVGRQMDSAEALEDLTPEFTAKQIEQSISLPVDPLDLTVQLQSKKDEPAPSPTPESVPTAPPQEKIAQIEEIKLSGNDYVYEVPKGYVALTFDDGPSKYTKEIVDILAEHKVAATFFFVGNRVARNVEAVKYADEHEMSIGSHSWDHSKLTSNGEAQNRNNFARVNQTLEEIIQSPITLFRPPYGAINDKVAAKVTEQKMKVVLWNRDTKDWNSKTPEDILKYVHHSDPSGGLYLFHEKKNTVEALPAIIKYFQEKNMKFVILK